MKNTLIATCILTFAIAGAGAQPTSSAAGNVASVTAKQLHKLTLAAHTPEQYKELSGYYAGLEGKFQRQAAEEKQEWQRRSQNVTVVAAKYPRPVDSSRYRYEYFTAKASEAGSMATKYAQMAAQ